MVGLISTLCQLRVIANSHFQVSVDKNQNRMQVSATAMRFPPLASRKTTIRLKLRPTVVAIAHNASCSSHQKRMSDSLSREKQPIETPSLSRDGSQHRSLASVRSLYSQSRARRKTLQSQTLLQRTDIPEVSAKSWMVYEMREGRALCGKRNYKKREMASLTKMMNLITILQLVGRAGADAKRVKVRATKNSCAMIGTTAQLKMGALYSLHDLYFGMMLPSGNDAAYLIAQIAGVILRTIKEGKADLQLLEDTDWMEGAMGRNNNVSLFLKEMNRLSWNIGMSSSNFANPHGLANPSNYSTALDLCKLCTYAMRNPQFRAIVNTQAYAYQCLLSPIVQVDKQNQSPNILPSCCADKPVFSSRWQNTNKMLGVGWSGIKTGVTPSAGPCLAASVTMNLGGKQYEFLVVLLQSESMEARWAQVRRLVEWAVQSRLYLTE